MSALVDVDNDDIEVDADLHLKLLIFVNFGTQPLTDLGAILISFSFNSELFPAAFDDDDDGDSCVR